jgi:two-component system, LuxR family, response regulator FixJ
MPPEQGFTMLETAFSVPQKCWRGHAAEMDVRSSNDGRSRKIYVVDDDAMVRRSMSFALQTAGYEVRPFASGDDFVEALPALPPGCVLLDLRMPGMDGFAVLDSLRKHRSTLPAVMMTGHGDVATAVKAMKAGAHDFIEKPCADDLLLDTLEATFQGAAEGLSAGALRNEAEARLRSLTRREFQVLQALAGGLPNKLIADRLGLSMRTVEMHRASIMDRLHLNSLAELLRLAFAADVEPIK